MAYPDKIRASVKNTLDTNAWMSNFQIEDFLKIVERYALPKYKVFFNYMPDYYPHKISPLSDTELVCCTLVNGNHFVSTKLSYLNTGSEKTALIELADSLHCSKEDLSDRHLIDHLKSYFSVIPGNKIIIKRLRVQNQLNGYDCGPYSIINCFLFALGRCPSNFNFDSPSRIRVYLKKVIDTGTFSLESIKLMDSSRGCWTLSTYDFLELPNPLPRDSITNCADKGKITSIIEIEDSDIPNSHAPIHIGDNGNSVEKSDVQNPDLSTNLEYIVKEIAEESDVSKPDSPDKINSIQDNCDGLVSDPQIFKPSDEEIKKVSVERKISTESARRYLKRKFDREKLNIQTSGTINREIAEESDSSISDLPAIENKFKPSEEDIKKVASDRSISFASARKFLYRLFLKNTKKNTEILIADKVRKAKIRENETPQKKLIG